MPNQRAHGQRLIALALKEELRDAAIEASGDNLSEFIRCAIYEKLGRAGVNLPRDVITAPRRARKAHELLLAAETSAKTPAPPTQRVRYTPGKKQVVKKVKVKGNLNVKQ